MVIPQLQKVSKIEMGGVVFGTTRPGGDFLKKVWLNQ